MLNNSNVLGGPLAAGILETMEGVRGMRAWQWFMLIEGAMSIFVALCAAYLLPNWGESIHIFLCRTLVPHFHSI